MSESDYGKSLSLSTLPWGLLMQFPRCVWLAAVSMAVPKDCGGVWCQVWCHVSLYCSHSKASLTIVLCVCVGFRSAQTHKASNPQSKSSPITAVALLTSCGDMKLNTCAVQSESALNTRVRSPLPVLRPSPLLSWFFKFEAGGEQANGRTTPPKFAFLATDSVLRLVILHPAATPRALKQTHQITES